MLNPQEGGRLDAKSFATEGIHDKVHDKFHGKVLDKVHDKVHDKRSWYQDLGGTGPA